jgi:hypothetical protein
MKAMSFWRGRHGAPKKTGTFQDGREPFFWGTLRQRQNVTIPFGWSVFSHWAPKWRVGFFKLINAGSKKWMGHGLPFYFGVGVHPFFTQTLTDKGPPPQTNHSTHCFSFVVGVLCLSVNLHEAGRIEAGQTRKPPAKCLC